MENFTSDINKLLNDELLAYKQLSSVLIKERESIINIDVNSLWKISAEKKKLVSSILSIKQGIISFFEKKFGSIQKDTQSFSVSNLITRLPSSYQEKLKFREILNEIRCEHEKVNQTANENKKYIYDYLLVIDDIMSVVVDNSKESQYDFSGTLPDIKQVNRLIKAQV